MYEKVTREIWNERGVLVDRIETFKRIRSGCEKNKLRRKRDLYNLPKTSSFEDVFDYEKYSDCTPRSSEKEIEEAITEFIDNVLDFEW